MEKINKETGEILEIGRGGLYTPLPVPAYKVLVAAKEHIAKDILLCIVSHLDKGGSKAFPSYTTIARESGHSRGSIRPALQVLYELEFIRLFQKPSGQRKRNFYYVQDSCYETSKMSAKALGYLPRVKECFYCGKGMRQGEFKIEGNYIAHYGCSGLPIRGARLSNMKNNQE